MGAFFSNPDRMKQLHDKLSDDLIAPDDRLQGELLLTPRRIGALIGFVTDINNVVAERCMGLFGTLKVDVMTHDQRLKRLENIQTIDPTPETEAQPQYVTDQIAQLKATVARLEQRLGSLQKQVVSIDRRTLP